VDFGREVRRRRKALGLTLEELAERADLTPNYVGSIETGKRDPSLSTIRALAEALMILPSELLGDVQDLSPAASEAGRLFQTAPPDVQEAVLVLLRALGRRRRG
jgi:transcriptional regulator with XRE-family HTH domain